MKAAGTNLRTIGTQFTRAQGAPRVLRSGATARAPEVLQPLDRSKRPDRLNVEKYGAFETAQTKREEADRCFATLHSGHDSFRSYAALVSSKEADCGTQVLGALLSTTIRGSFEGDRFQESSLLEDVQRGGAVRTLLATRFQTMFEEGSALLRRKGGENANHLDGSLVTGVLLPDPERSGSELLAIAHLGDCRAYLKTDRTTRLLTQDHSDRQDRISAGSIPLQLATRMHPRSSLTRSLLMDGAQPGLVILRPQGAATFANATGVLVEADSVVAGQDDEDVVPGGNPSLVFASEGTYGPLSRFVSSYLWNESGPESESGCTAKPGSITEWFRDLLCMRPDRGEIPFIGERRINAILHAAESPFRRRLGGLGANRAAALVEIARNHRNPRVGKEEASALVWDLG